MSTLGKHWKIKDTSKMKGRPKGVPTSLEARKRMGEAQKLAYKRGTRIHPLLGKTFSEESKLKMSLSHMGQEVSQETKNKLSLSHSGSNHWNWKEDRTKLSKRQERNDSAYRNWRLEVYERDNYTCCINNKDCCGRIIAHHILGWTLFPELRYTLNNGITLCQAHHPLKRAEEKRLIPIFTELVSVSN